MTTTSIKLRDADGNLQTFAMEQGANGLSPHTTLELGGSAVAEGNPLPVTGNVGGYAAIATASFARPANTTAYASGELVANSTTVGSVAAMAVAAARMNGGTGLIVRARLAKSSTSLTAASFRVHIYGVAPTSAAGDGAAYSTDQAVNHLGTFDVTMDQAFTDGAAGASAPGVGTSVVFAASAGSQDVYALIEARDAYTPASGEAFTLSLEVLQN